MCELSRVAERVQLLQVLRSTVEGLLVSQVSNVWNVYGGLNRLHNIVERIFKHGCRVFDQEGEPDCWVFIEGLNWLQPLLATSPSIHESEEYLANLPTRIAVRKDLLWLYKSLESHSLSMKLSWLLSDQEHLLSCLEPWAFLCQESLAEATLMCLRAVERNQPVLLLEIDPCLFLPTWDLSRTFSRKHRRSSSFPTNLSCAKWTPKNPQPDVIPKKAENKQKNTSKHPEDESQAKSKSKIKSVPHLRKLNMTPPPLVKTWRSLPSLLDHHATPKKITSSLHSTPVKFILGAETGTDVPAQSSSYKLSNVIKVDYSSNKPKAGLSRHQPSRSSLSSLDGKLPRKARAHPRASSKERRARKLGSTSGSSDTLKYDETTQECLSAKKTKSQSNSTRIMKIPTKTRRKSSIFSGSTPEMRGSWSSEVEGQKEVRSPKKSFMEDGGSSVQPMATGYFPRPQQGQSLMSFLSSAQFARANAELDRENAHFSISEAMIAAIEQVKCNRRQRLVDEAAEESDEEINNLKQRIRLRRRQKQEERCKGVWSRELLSDGKTDTTTTDQSVSSLSTSPGTLSDSIATDDIDDLDVDDVQNISQLRNSGISMSLASLYSEAELCKPLPRYGTESTLTESFMSAEGVALSLISRFSEKQLPRASELEWLVSEQDAPQQLLPLPASWPVSPDEAENEDMSQATPLRGTMEWAPPRPQIIFTPHPTPVRRILMAKQNYRCAGCGMKVAVEYANRFRYCEYLGRYFCTGCHNNQLALIPGKVLSKWDFNRYPVSNFSYRLLDQMAVDPLFQVNDLNATLYRRIKQLERTRLLRTQLFFLKDFLFACRFAALPQDALHKEAIYMLNDPHVYAMQDLVQVKSGELPNRLRELVQVCCAHVLQCELCQARGFVCELCCSREVIFPWQLLKVTRCDQCGACFHARCKNAANRPDCPRCARLRARRASQEETS